MEKKGLFGILSTILLALLIAVVCIAVYFYYFHVFQTVRICVSGDSQNTNITCQVDDDCRGVTKLFFQDFDFSGAPDILSNNVALVINESIYCDEFCFVRNNRGFNSTSEKLEFLESCEDNETEIAVEIRGKDAIQLFKWIR